MKGRTKRPQTRSKRLFWKRPGDESWLVQKVRDVGDDAVMGKCICRCKRAHRWLCLGWGGWQETAIFQLWLSSALARVDAPLPVGEAPSSSLQEMAPRQLMERHVPMHCSVVKFTYFLVL